MQTCICRSRFIVIMFFAGPGPQDFHPSLSFQALIRIRRELVYRHWYPEETYVIIILHIVKSGRIIQLAECDAEGGPMPACPCRRCQDRRVGRCPSCLKYNDWKGVIQENRHKAGGKRASEADPRSRGCSGSDPGGNYTMPPDDSNKLIFR